MSNNSAPLLRHDVGSVFKKEYKGKDIVVKVTKQGYIYNGKPYRTLSAAVAKITGRPTPANVFFGLETTPRGEKRKKSKKSASNGHAPDIDTDIQENAESTNGGDFISVNIPVADIRKIVREEIKNFFRNQD